MTDPLTLLRTDDADRLTALTSRLAAEAEREGLLDLAYRTVDSPVGPLLLVATPEGLVRVAFAVQDHDAVLAGLAVAVSPRLLPAAGRLDPAAQQLDEYFSGRRDAFALPLDLRLTGGFRRRVVERLTTIGYGRTGSYAELAAAAGSPRAFRAVGTACATNPLPVVLPCHRVLPSGGSVAAGRVGGYAGGAEAKRWLLGFEAAHR
ncbi:methylated-DNA-[protein]-cysteine S-methyltransferase [Friedmanniella endophytica]|uniref:Methylated-DNA--protein-cysteine methyltransferase n=1 Tax=Microlunatus kandeliicorticis TaxID=1759536 RepID=A0A7W3IQR8_9ACTN|nr:methylated-DNA--[protein]-cysteine S-methyltransferase [Microlunatus kandeliicorticis]MBA8793506.1 methylated-DNA-[protein]-cysteine S-methyltransferase [Microlunatus kandeliicorticis]